MMGGRAGYEGAFYDLINSGPQISSPADLSINTLLGNAFFLQTILVPTFGSNGPLWSLANEFWYYFMFPFLFLGIIGNSWGPARAAMAIIGIALAVLLPKDMVLLGLIWMAGAIAHYTLRYVRRPTSQRVPSMCFVGALLAVGGATILDKMRPGIASDLVLGGAFACIFPVLTILPSLGATYDRVAQNLANISYTLYATHFPVLAFIWFVVLAPHKWAVGGTAALVMGFLICTTLVLAAGMWWLFERNTDRVRTILESWLLVRAT
jgi:peptidoglycan/LPS O-acetylase OafA/YrhL